MAIALAIAPFVFIAVGFISRNPLAPKKVLIAMGLLLGVGLSVGLIAPILGAAAGFGVGIAITLNLPAVERQMRRRLIGVGLAFAYMLLMLFMFPPAGVLAGSILPALSIGFADEYGAWRHTRGRAPD